jgi:hypothetical protein
MQNALASNAGDRYHFVYAARRMLDMLNPRNNLQLIVMGNVTVEDQLFGGGYRVFPEPNPSTLKVC